MESFAPKSGAALEAQYRSSTDTWREFIFSAKYRWHDQTGAHFFRDIFPRFEATNFRGRDKELSPLTSQTVRFSVAYEFLSDGMGFLDKGTVNFSLDHLMIDYEEFRDISTGAALGDEPFYHLDANVLQLFVSLWY